MVPHATRLRSSDLALDRWLAEAVARLSSSSSAREAAQAWLTAYDRARASGSAQDEACDEADAADERSVGASRQAAATLAAELRVA